MEYEAAESAQTDVPTLIAVAEPHAEPLKGIVSKTIVVLLLMFLLG
jgi:hypothetical protein